MNIIEVEESACLVKCAKDLCRVFPGALLVMLVLMTLLKEIDTTL